MSCFRAECGLIIILLITVTHTAHSTLYTCNVTNLRLTRGKNAFIFVNVLCVLVIITALSFTLAAVIVTVINVVVLLVVIVVANLITFRKAENVVREFL